MEGLEGSESVPSPIRRLSGNKNVKQYNTNNKIVGRPLTILLVLLRFLEYTSQLYREKIERNTDNCLFVFY